MTISHVYNEHIMHTRPRYVEKVTSYKTVHKVTTLSNAFTKLQIIKKRTHDKITFVKFVLDSWKLKFVTSCS